MNSDDQKFFVAFIINLILAIVFLALFVVCRLLFPKVYQPRCDESKNAPPAPPRSLFGWVGTTIRYSDEEVFRTHGLDAMMFLKFVKMMLYIVIIVSIYGFVVLFAVNATGENTKNRSSLLYVNGLNSLTMSGVSEGSHRLVAHIFSVIFNTVTIFYFTYQMYRTYMLYRFRFKSSPDRIENFSIMIREVPTTVTDETLHNFFDRLFPGKVLSVIRAYSTAKLAKKIEKRDDQLREVEKAYAIYRQTGKRPTKKDKILVGKVLDSIDFHTKKFNKFTEEAVAMQKHAWPRSYVVFVVFKDRESAAQCSQILLDGENTLMPEPAPEPRDLIWKHFNIGHHQYMIRKLVINVFFFFLIFFYTIPVSFVSGLSNLDNLSKLGPFKFLVKLIELNGVINGFVQGFLPTLALTIFFALLLTIITFAVTQMGVYTQSKISRAVMTKYFAFQVFNVLLVYTISGAVFNVLNKIIDNPSDLVNILATSLPQQSGFFINYVMLLSLSGQTQNLWNPGFLVVRWIKQKFLCKTAREFKETDNPGPFNFAQSYTNHLLVFTILVTYSTLAPFIMVWGILYFCMAYVSNKYNILYVNFPQFEGGGIHWLEVFNRIIAGTFLYQLVLVGVFGIYKFFAGSVIAAICAVCTITYCWYAHKQFERSSRFLPLRYALDLTNKLDDVNKIEKGEISHDDVVPSMAPKDKTEINNLNCEVYYYQPSLVPLVDEPEIDAPLPTSPKRGISRKGEGEEQQEIRKGIDSGEGDV